MLGPSIRHVPGLWLLLLFATACAPAVASGERTDVNNAGLDAQGGTCSKGPAGFRDQRFTLRAGGANRNFFLHVPASYDGRSNVPLVVDLHGLTSNATQQRALSGWLAVADREGFVVATPNGLGSSWNAGACCGSSARSGVDDVGFMRALVEDVAKRLCIDPARVFVSGLSNGAMMSLRLGCEASDLFAAIAPVSGSTVVRNCQPGRAVPVALFRGTSDTLVPFRGNGLFRGAEAELAFWEEQNGCDGDTAERDRVCDVASECADGSEAMLCALDAGHVAYRNRSGLNIAESAWSFFVDHPKE